MKKITIVGAGIAGLRAACELVKAGGYHVVMVEKSSSVGGRVATRRFAHTHTNHGALSFDGWERARLLDDLAREYEVEQDLPAAATDLPKKLRDDLLQHPDRFTLRTKWQAQEVGEGSVVGSDGEKIESDVVVLTAPTPQVESLCRCSIPQVQYTKSILIVGEIQRQSVRWEMDRAWSEEHFEMTDTAIIAQAQLALGNDLSGLSVKKWRYARVAVGMAVWFLPLSENVLVAGDAFDPAGKYDLSSSWLSGLQVARFIMEKYNA